MANYTLRKDTNCYGLTNTNQVDETLAPEFFNTPEMCNFVCTLSEKCHNAVFVNNTKRCFLKNNITTCVKQPGEDSYLKPNVLPPSFYNINFYN